ncbi:hypothetical protein OG612_00485 [Streptomyces sp. NBC_01527]
MGGGTAQEQALLHRVDSSIGLTDTDTDLAALDEWVQDLSGTS